jgi:hypothetical protein
MKLGIFFLILASIAFGQMDSATLRAKFGAPLTREVFTIRSGIEMTVEYSPTGNLACRIEFPGLAPVPANAPPGLALYTQTAIDDLIAGIVPLSMRGKEGGKFCNGTGRAMMCSANYENVSITESLDGGRRTAVVVKFKIAGCSNDH